MFVLPMQMAPAARRRATQKEVAFVGDVKSSFEPVDLG